MLLIQIIPVTVPTWGVFADDLGSPEFVSCVGLGLVEFPGPDNTRRVVAGLCIGDHIEPADLKPNFVGYAQNLNAEEWRDRCAAKRDQMRKAEEAAQQQKIIVPPSTSTVDWEKTRRN